MIIHDSGSGSRGISSKGRSEQETVMAAIHMMRFFTIIGLVDVVVMVVFLVVVVVELVVELVAVVSRRTQQVFWPTPIVRMIRWSKRHILTVLLMCFRLLLFKLLAS